MITKEHVIFTALLIFTFICGLCLGMFIHIDKGSEPDSKEVYLRQINNLNNKIEEQNKLLVNYEATIESLYDKKNSLQNQLNKVYEQKDKTDNNIKHRDVAYNIGILSDFLSEGNN